MNSRPPASALDPFLEVLRAHRFPVGIGHRLRLLQALDTWQGAFPPHRLRTLLCPIFATNAEEQRLFYHLFDKHFLYFASADPVTSSGKSGPATLTRVRVTPRSVGHRWIRLVLVPFFALILASGAFSIWYFRRPEPPPPPHALPPPSWSLTKPYQPLQSTVVPEQTTPWKPVVSNGLVVSPMQPRTGWRWTGLLLLPIFLWGLMEAWAWRRRQVLLESAASKSLTVSSFRRVVLAVRAAPRTGLSDTLRRLRHPTAGPLRLQLGKTVTATIRSNGFPDFRYEPVFRRPEYLVLIDRVSIRDHQATLFEELVALLDRHGLRVTAYTFSGDPRVCRNVKTGHSVYLADLLPRAADYRLIVFGEGDRLVCDWGDVAPAGRMLLRWPLRGILTPREPGQWGRHEFHLARHFVLLPATVASLAASVDFFDPDHSARLRRPASKFDHREPDLDRATPSEIRRVLGDDALYRWLCACALYPQLQWDVTLQLGAKLGPDLLSESNLQKLFRLPWFRRGFLPVSLQQALAESLDATTRACLRTAILELFEEAPPLPDGPIADAHRLEIAIQRLDILPEERRRILDDEATARVVAEVDVPPIALVASPALRKTLFPHGLPTLGFRAGARRALALFAGLVIACIVGSAWYSAGEPLGRLSLVTHPPGPPPDWAPTATNMRLGDQVQLNPRDGLTYVWIPPGNFTMGCSPQDSECYPDEQPPHEVTIARGFWLGQTEVTVSAYERFGKSAGQPSSAASGNRDLPQVNVSWEEARQYCEWAGLRLPTEAEWEYAARANTPGPRYGALDAVAWYNGNSGGKLHRVARKQQNAWGLYDMLGNAWEWVADWFGDNYYEQRAGMDPVGPPSGQYRIVRGGSWYNIPRYLRVSFRRVRASIRLDQIGFRCAGDVANWRHSASR
jgi:formylglycine-generating enzyme required for sulfatase activity